MLPRVPKLLRAPARPSHSLSKRRRADAVVAELGDDESDLELRQV